MVCIQMGSFNMTSPEAVTFLPFTRPTIDEETIQGVVEVLRSGWITTGSQVHALENALSAMEDARSSQQGLQNLQARARVDD